MYAVIRSGGKQYRVAPGDVIKVEKTQHSGGDIEFADVLAVSGNTFSTNAKGARVTGEVMEEGRGDKILVFKFKRKKQYKKLIGHRQQFTAVRITGIEFNGEKASVPALGVHKAKAESGASHAKRSRAAGSGKVAKKATKAKATAKKTSSKKKKK
jgi:large subunit ribosomal protein L21